MRRNLLLILTAVIGLAAVLAVGVFIYGANLSPQHDTTVHAVYDAPRSAVWATIADVERYPQWLPEVEAIEVLSAPGGEGADGALSFRETNAFGELTYVVTEEEPPERLVLEVPPGQASFSGRWIYTLTSVPEGTRVTLTEQGRIDSAMLRGLGAIFTRPDATIRAYLEALGARLGSRAEVVLDEATR